MKQILLLAATALFGASLFLTPAFALAQTPGDFDPGQGTGSLVPQCTGKTLGEGLGKECTFCDLMTLVQNVLNFILFMAVITAGGLFAWAGWLFATSGGGGQLSQAKKIFKNAIIGLVLVIGAYTIVSTIMKTLGGGNPLDSWDNICPKTTNQ